MAWWAGISSLQPAPGPEEKRVNLLFILTDQQPAHILEGLGLRQGTLDLILNVHAAQLERHETLCPVLYYG